MMRSRRSGSRPLSSRSIAGTEVCQLPLRAANVSSPPAESTEKSVSTKPSRSSCVMLEIHSLSVPSTKPAPRPSSSRRTKSEPSTTHENGSCCETPATEESTTA